MINMKNNLKKLTVVSGIMILFVFVVGNLTADTEKFRYNSKGRKNPFAPPVAKKTELSVEDFSNMNLSIEGIIWDEKKPLAIVNGKIVKEGDIIEGIVVSEILKDSVVFIIDYKKYEIKIKKEENLL